MSQEIKNASPTNLCESVDRTRHSVTASMFPLSKIAEKCMGSLTTTKKNKTANTGLEQARKIPPIVPVVSGAFELSINNAPSGASYVGWSLAACSLRITNQPQPDLNVVLINRSSTGGQIVFRTSYAGPDEDALALTLPGNGTKVDFFVGGKFGSPSIDDQDGGISVTDFASNVLHERTLMVRIRKDANNLTGSERDRFLYAYAALNQLEYQGFLDSHNEAASREIHVRPAFLPWHRAFILHLERRLQFIDSSVALPYWRFDRPAPNIFSPDFMGGSPNGVGRVSFSATNDLRNWTVNGTPGVIRVPSFNTNTAGALVMSQDDTLALGANFFDFRTMESDPHGAAHSSFGPSNSNGDGAPITYPPTATQDPLFFLLHCNVDRLWAQWQLHDSANPRWDISNGATYSAIRTPDEGPPKVGDALTDTMWPWNQDKVPPRPKFATLGELPQLPFPSKPGPSAVLGDVIDYIGRKQGNSNHFDYDDMPFL